LDPTACLRIATRLHFMMRRHLDQEFEVGVLMQGGFEARAALRLCRNSGLPELIALAQELERAHRADAKASARRAAAVAAAKAARAAQRAKSSGLPTAGRKAQDLEWSRDTSGFGLSEPPRVDLELELEFEPPAAEPKVGWLARLGLAPRNSGR
jgi:hypothetical protein